MKPSFSYGFPMVFYTFSQKIPIWRLPILGQHQTPDTTSRTFCTFSRPRLMDRDGLVRVWICMDWGNSYRKISWSSWENRWFPLRFSLQLIHWLCEFAWKKSGEPSAIFHLAGAWQRKVFAGTIMELNPYMDPNNEKVQKVLQIQGHYTPVPFPFRRYGWIYHGTGTSPGNCPTWGLGVASAWILEWCLNPSIPRLKKNKQTWVTY